MRQCGNAIAAARTSSPVRCCHPRLSEPEAAGVPPDTPAATTRQVAQLCGSPSCAVSGVPSGVQLCSRCTQQPLATHALNAQVLQTAAESVAQSSTPWMSLGTGMSTTSGMSIALNHSGFLGLLAQGGYHNRRPVKPFSNYSLSPLATSSLNDEEPISNSILLTEG